MGMPRAVAKDQRWLPAIGRRVPFAVPEPVGLGVPTPEFERPWSVYRWIEGVPAGEAVIAGLDDFAGDVARFLVRRGHRRLGQQLELGVANSRIGRSLARP